MDPSDTLTNRDRNSWSRSSIERIDPAESTPCPATILVGRLGAAHANRRQAIGGGHGESATSGTEDRGECRSGRADCGFADRVSRRRRAPRRRGRSPRARTPKVLPTRGCPAFRARQRRSASRSATRPGERWWSSGTAPAGRSSSPNGPHPIDSSLNGVSCPSVTTCVAVGVHRVFARQRDERQLQAVGRAMEWGRLVDHERARPRQLLRRAQWSVVSEHQPLHRRRQRQRQRQRADRVLERFRLVGHGRRRPRRFGRRSPRCVVSEHEQLLRRRTLDERHLQCDAPDGALGR